MIEDVNNFGILTNNEEKQFRLSTCNSCEHNAIINDNPTCMKCACPIEYIITYKFKSCPIGIWKV